jgi:hypothetical protein
MSCPVPASGPPVIDTRPAYVEYRRDAALIAERFGFYTPIQARPAAETPIMPQTSAALAGFSGVEREIRQLLESEAADEFGPVRPADNSVELARKTLFQLVQAGFEVPPVREAGTDHDGALRLAWENGPRFLELVVPRENHAAAYLYYSQGDQYNLQRDLTFNAVRERFNWLSA